MFTIFIEHRKDSHLHSTAHNSSKGENKEDVQARIKRSLGLTDRMAVNEKG